MLIHTLELAVARVVQDLLADDSSGDFYTFESMRRVIRKKLGRTRLTTRTYAAMRAYNELKNVRLVVEAYGAPHLTLIPGSLATVSSQDERSCTL